MCLPRYRSWRGNSCRRSRSGIGIEETGGVVVRRLRELFAVAVEPAIPRAFTVFDHDAEGEGIGAEIVWGLRVSFVENFENDAPSAIWALRSVFIHVHTSGE